MRFARSSLVITMAVAINVGLMYSQLCTLFCEVTRCSSSVVKYAVSTHEASGSKSDSGCGHQSDKGTERENHHGQNRRPVTPTDQDNHKESHCPHECDQVGLLSSGDIYVAASSQHVQPAVGELPAKVFIPLIGSPIEVAVGMPDRSPPRRLISILRI